MGVRNKYNGIFITKARTEVTKTLNAFKWSCCYFLLFLTSSYLRGHYPTQLCPLPAVGGFKNIL